MKNLISRKKLLLITMLITCIAGFAQDTLKFNKYREFPDYVTQVFKQNHPELTFLKYRAFTPIRNIFDFYTGMPSESSSTDSVCNVGRYLSLVKTLAVANYDTTGNINMNYTINNMINYVSKGLTPISLSFVEYSEFKDSAIALNCIGFNNNQFTENCPTGFYPFQKNRLFASSSLNQIIYSSQVNFLINDSLILSNIPTAIDSIYIDFADGNGLIPVIKGNTYSVNYGSDGIKKVQVKIKSATNYYKSFFTLYDSASVGNPLSRNSGNNSVSSCANGVQLPDEVRGISFGSITGKFGIWYSTCGSTITQASSYGAGLFIPSIASPPHEIRKPFILSTGFNPGNGKQLLNNGGPNFLNFVVDLVTINAPLGGYGGEWRGTMYETYNGSILGAFDPGTGCPDGTSNDNRFLDRLRAEGYDVIILQYDNGMDFIENNAALLTQLIKDINAEKMRNGFFFENVVSGVSAGAVSTRLALAELEKNFRAGGPHPHTKEWISIEGEHQASGVPLGFQYLLDYQANPVYLLEDFLTSGIDLIADSWNCVVANIANTFNHSPTATELTKFSSSYGATGVNPLRQHLVNVFNTISGNTSNGYPEFVRRVGVSNGSGVGVQIPHSQDYIFDAQLGWNAGTGTATSFPSGCGGQYTWYLPGFGKRTVANWWNNNNSDIFSGYGYIDSRFTVEPMLCVNLPVFGCQCVGPNNIGSVITFGNQTISRPTITDRFDDVPASTQSTHQALYGRVHGAGNDQSAYPFYNNNLAGNDSHCYIDPNLHGFVPVVSAFDLQQTPNGNFTTPVSLNLMFNRTNNAGTPIAQANNNWGFPFLKNANPHAVTPFDAVFTCGNHDAGGLGLLADGSTVRPDNQYHVEDPLKPMTDFLVRVEVAPVDLYLSDRIIGSTLLSPCPTLGCYTAEFEARNSITVGNGIYGMNPDPTNTSWEQNNLTPDGDFGVTNNAKIIMHSGNLIGIMPGTSFPAGGEIEAFIKAYPCTADADWRLANNNQAGGTINGNSLTTATDPLPLAKNVISAQKTAAIKVYPNPSNGTISIERESEDPLAITICDLNGKIVYTGTVTGSGVNNLDISTVQNGAYLLQAGNNKFKLMVVK